MHAPNICYLVEKRVRCLAAKHKFFARDDIIFLAAKRSPKSAAHEKNNAAQFESAKIRVCKELINRIAGPMRVCFAAKINKSVSVIISTETMDDENEKFLESWMKHTNNKSDKNTLSESNLYFNRPITIKKGVKYIKLLNILSNKDVVEYYNKAFKPKIKIGAPVQLTPLGKLIKCIDDKYPGRARSLQCSAEKLQALLQNDD